MDNVKDVFESQNRSEDIYANLPLLLCQNVDV